MPYRRQRKYRQYDYENFLSTLLLNDKLRTCGFIIRAFNVEVSRVQEQVTEENIGLMRFQFWSDTLDKIYSKNNNIFPAHPVAQELCRVCCNFDISKRHLSKLVNSRKNIISKKYYNSLEEMEKYSDESVSPIFYLLLEIAGHRNVHCDHAASHLGKAQGLTNLLRSVEKSSEQRFVALPMDLLLKHNVSQESVLRCLESQSMKDVVFEIASRANQHLTKARSIVVPPEVKEIFLPAVVVDSYLKRLQNNDFNLFHKRVKERNNLLPFYLYWNKLRSKY